MKPDGEEGNDEVKMWPWVVAAAAWPRFLNLTTGRLQQQLKLLLIDTLLVLVLVLVLSLSGANLNAAGPGPAQRTIFVLKTKQVKILNYTEPVPIANTDPFGSYSMFWLTVTEHPETENV